MPHMNGAETVAAIRQQPRLKDVRIVVVSGEDRDDAMMAGDGGRVSQWFSKPLNPELLVQHLTLAGA
jgi:CheY-like chemotaxis protein